MVEDEEMEVSGVSGNEEEMAEEAEAESGLVGTDLSQKHLGATEKGLGLPQHRGV